MTDDIRLAIQTLVKAAELVALDLDTIEFERFQAIKILHHAVRHLAYPDRDVYPKTRRGTKRNPVNLYHGQRDDLR